MLLWMIAITSPSDASGLLVLPWIFLAGGAVMLCLGVARLVAKADVAHADRKSNGTH